MKFRNLVGPGNTRRTDGRAASGRTKTMRVLYLLLVLIASGCATVTNVDTSGSANIGQALKEGDQITVTTRDDQTYRLTVVGVSDEAIEGEGKDGQPVAIEFQQIVELQVRKPRPGRTAALVGGTIGGVMLLYLIASAVAAATLLSAL